MSSTPQRGRFAGVFLIFTLAALMLQRHYLSAPARLPHRRRWQSVLGNRYDASISAHCLLRAEEQYRTLCARRPLPRHPVLRYHVIYQILPALAIYRALCEELVNPRRAYDEVELLVWEEVRPIYRPATTLLTRLPDPFACWRVLVRVAMRTTFPSAGWLTRPIATSPRHFGFDVIGCVYFDTLRDLDAPELAPIFCQMDDRLAQLTPDCITWHRSGTLARGQVCCDFRWSAHSSLVAGDPGDTLCQSGAENPHA